MGPVNYAQKFRKHGGDRILSFETGYWKLQATSQISWKIEASSKACEFGHRSFEPPSSIALTIGTTEEKLGGYVQTTNLATPCNGKVMQCTSFCA